ELDGPVSRTLGTRTAPGARSRVQHGCDHRAALSSWAHRPQADGRPPRHRFTRRLITRRRGVIMATTKMLVTTNATPEQYTAALTDFGPGRSKICTVAAAASWTSS